jgi:hypothetical protein
VESRETSIDGTINKSRLSSRTNAALQIPQKITRSFSLARVLFFRARRGKMLLRDEIKEAGATGYILLWLLGIPIPILLIIFLLRGCT